MAAQNYDLPWGLGTVSVETVVSSNNMAMYSGYYNYTALAFIFLGLAVALPGIILALPLLGLFKGIEMLGGYANTYAGSYAKKYAMFAGMYMAATLRNLVQ